MRLRLLSPRVQLTGKNLWSFVPQALQQDKPNLYLALSTTLPLLLRRLRHKYAVFCENIRRTPDDHPGLAARSLRACSYVFTLCFPFVAHIGCRTKEASWVS